MRAINHALTGAVLGVLIGQPLVALPLAFASHFICDAIPHFGINGSEDVGKPWFYWLLTTDAVLCAVLVAVLAVTQPQHWLVAAICAFLATSPDLFSVTRLLRQRRGGDPRPNPRNAFVMFHHKIQWFERPPGALVEGAWCVAMVVILTPFIRR